MLTKTKQKLIRPDVKKSPSTRYRQIRIVVLSTIFIVLLFISWQGKQVILSKTNSQQAINLAKQSTSASLEGNYKMAFATLNAGYEHQATSENIEQSAYQLLNSSLQFFHSENYHAILYTAFSPDGKTFVTGSSSGEVNIWTLDGQLVNTYQHDAPIKKAGFSKDGVWLYSLGKDNQVKIWQTNHRPMLAFPDQKEVFDVNFRDDGKTLLTGVHDKSVKIWNLDLNDPYSPPKILRHKTFLSHVSYLPNSKNIVSATIDGYLYFWKNSEALDTIIDAHKGIITTLQVGENYFLTASIDRTVKLWHQHNYKNQTTIQLKDKITKAIYLPTLKQILTLEEGSKEVQRWSINGKRLAAYQHTDKVTTFNFNEKQNEILTADNAGIIKVWSLSGKELKEYKHHKEVDIVTGNRLGYILSNGLDNSTRLWNSHQQLIAIDSLSKPITFFSNQKELQISTDKGWVMIDLNTKKPSQKPALSISLDHTKILHSDEINDNIIVSQGKEAIIYKDGKEENRLTHNNEVILAYHLPKSSTILTATANQLNFWDATNSNLLKSIKMNGEILDLSWSSSLASAILILKNEKSYEIIAITQQGKRKQLYGQPTILSNLSISLDGNSIAAMSQNDVMIILDKSGKMINVCEHKSPILQLQFIENNQLLTMAMDSTIRLFQSSGQLLQEFQHRHSLEQFVWTSKFPKQFAVRSSQEYIYWWQLLSTTDIIAKYNFLNDKADSEFFDEVLTSR